MIQSHYVPSERPYRIIYTGGVVGLQIGTLIVVDDQTQYLQSTVIERGGNRALRGFYRGVRTYSYPVVSYINKQKEEKQRITSDIAYDVNEYGESVVWNNVRMEDVATICLENQQVPWDDMLPIIQPAIEKCTDMAATREELAKAFRIFSKVTELGGSISQPEGLETEYLAGGGSIKKYVVELFCESYEDEDGNEVYCYRSYEAGYLPFFAIEGEEAYKILDYQRLMYERRLRYLDRGVGTQIKLSFKMIKSENEQENQKVEIMVNKLNARNR